MQYRIFKISCAGDIEAEEALNQFLRSRRIVSVTKEMTELTEGKFWCFCVEYLDLESGKPGFSSPKATERVDYKEVLSPESFAIFVKLRNLRKDLALQEAIPVYAVCTNEQMAQMIQLKCQTLDEIKKIPGLGDAKIQKYGEHFLRVLLSDLRKEEKPNETSGTPDREDF